MNAGMRSGKPPLTFDDLNAEAFLQRLKVKGPEGDQAFNELVCVLHARMQAHVRRQLRSPEEAQEVVQDVFLAALKGINGFEGKSKLTTWIYSLAHHKICDRIADRGRTHAPLLESHDRLSTTEGSAAEWANVSAWDSAPDRVHARNSAGYWMARAVENLGSPGREVYQLRDVEGLSGEDVAQILGLSHIAVRLQLHRARANIVVYVRQHLENPNVARGIRKNLGGSV
jgi:RNA polymerase sigma-70 factor (ECF subfamily)